MSKSVAGIVHGITSVIFDCMDCGIRWESRNGVGLGLAAKHWHKTGHHIIGEVAIGWSFPKKQAGGNMRGVCIRDEKSLKKTECGTKEEGKAEKGTD